MGRAETKDVAISERHMSMTQEMPWVRIKQGRGLDDVWGGVKNHPRSVTLSRVLKETSVRGMVGRDSWRYGNDVVCFFLYHIECEASSARTMALDDIKALV